MKVVVMRRTAFSLMIAICALAASTATAAECSTLLVDAAEKLERAAVEWLVQQGADVQQTQADGMTALHWTVYHDERELSELLIRAGADVKATNRYGVTPLSLACENGNADLVGLLLDRGADPKTSLPGGESALMTAARTGVLRTVDVLIARGAEINAQERRGQTALMWAAAEGHADVVQSLIGAGADFRVQLPSGFSAYFFAAREGHGDVLQVLLQAGVDVNSVMQPSTPPTGRAPATGTSALLLAVENGHFAVAVQLLEAGADPNDQRNGFTPLHALSWVRKPNRGDGLDGEPAPRGSGNITSLQLVRELVGHGADVNARLQRGESGRGILNRVGATPFLLASKTADLPLMQLLVELGADPSLPNADGCTPLMAAAGIGTLFPGEEAGTEEEVIAALEFLLAHAADINTVDANGETAMHGAAYKSLPRVVQLLADRGANIELWNRQNKYGWTPLTIAQGHRVGNFKPNVETMAALRQVMLAAGVTPSEDSAVTSGDDYKK